MLKKSLLFYLIFILPAFASGRENIPQELIDEFVATFSNKLQQLQPQAQEKTAEEILAENAHKPEYKSCGEWLAQEYPDFSEPEVSSHPLYSLLKEAMSLADFEVDMLELFTHRFMKTNMPAENAENLLVYITNSMSAKLLVGNLIELLQQKTTAENMLKDYFSNRVECLLESQAKYLDRQKSRLDMSRVEANRLSSNNASSTEWQDLDQAFMRSYNTKNKIMRDLLYYLADQDSIPLIQRLPRPLIGLMQIATSLHSYFNKENDVWVSYDDAIGKGEIRNYLGNARELAINLQEILKNNRIQGYSIPKTYKKMQDMPYPTFLLGKGSQVEQKEEKSFPASKDQQKKKGKKKGNKKSRVRSSAKKRATPAGLLSNNNPAAEHSSQKLGQETDVSSSTSVVPASSSSKVYHESANETLNSISIDISLSDIPQASIEINQNFPYNKIGKTSIVSTVAPAEKIAEKIGNKHIKTIYDIFRPKGYSLLNDQRIIKAWKHIMKGKGWIKKDTGRSHQPLYASLSEGSHVVLGLFRSSSYGPRYVKYIQEAFEKIGFGRAWLEENGYRLN